MKTNKSASKRFRKTANGYKFRHAFRNHMMSNKTSKQKRLLRTDNQVAFEDQDSISRMLPYKRL